MPSSSLYHKLPIRPWQTRLLQLQPDVDGSPISGQLIVADTTSRGAVLHKEQFLVQYKALSYTWGTGRPSCRILLNGTHFDVSENLHQFLLQYRKGLEIGPREFIWIDAVSINQDDPKEKSVQVANILSVYEKAQQVIVWLGVESLHTGMAFRLLNQARIPGKTTVEELDEPTTHGLLDLYNREWPRRIWVKQEVWAAKDIAVRCGVWETTWSNYKSWLDRLPPKVNRTLRWSWLSAFKALQQKSDIKAGVLDEYGELRTASHFGTLDGQDLLALLTTSTACQSTDIRDRVYALLGMSTDRSFEVNYTNSALEVFTSLARHIVLTRDSIEIVMWFAAHQSLSGLFGNRGELANLPSWAPDWRSVAFTSDMLVYRKHLLRFHSNFSLATSILSDFTLNFAGRTGAENLERVLPKLCALAKDVFPSPFDPAQPRVLILHGFRLVLDEITHGSSRNAVLWIPLHHCSRDSSRWNSQAPSEPKWVEDALQSWENQDTMKHHDITDRQDLTGMLGVLSTAAKILVSLNPEILMKTFGTIDEVKHSTQRFGTSEMYCLGLPPGERIRPGDVVICAHQCSLPVFLRPTSAHSKQDGSTMYKFLGFVSLSKLNTTWDSIPEHGSNIKHFYWELQMALRLKAKYGLLESFQVR